MSDGQSNQAISADKRIAKKIGQSIKNVIAVSSGKGGVGKSTIATNIAIALQQSGAAVGLLDADILGPNLPMMMGLDELPPPDEKGTHPALAYGVKVMSMGFMVAPEQALIWRGPILHGLIQQFFTELVWGELDYLVVDLPPGTGDAQLSLSQSVPITGSVIVTQPQNVAVGDALRAIAMFDKMEVPTLGVVENMSGEFFGAGGGEELAKRCKVPFLGSVPLDPKVRVGGDIGQPIMVSDPDSAAAKVLREVAEKVAERIEEFNAVQDETIIPIATIE